MTNEAPSTGLTQQELREIVEYYDNQSEEDAIAEAEAAFKDADYVWIQVPRELAHKVELLIQDFEDRQASRQQAKKKARKSA